MQGEKDFLLIKNSGKIYAGCINHINYFPDSNTIITCSRDAEKSLIIKFVDNRIKPYIFKMKQASIAEYLI